MIAWDHYQAQHGLDERQYTRSCPLNLGEASMNMVTATLSRLSLIAFMIADTHMGLATGIRLKHIAVRS